MAKLGIINTKNNEINGLIDWHVKNNQLDNPFLDLSKLSDFIF